MGLRRQGSWHPGAFASEFLSPLNLISSPESQGKIMDTVADHLQTRERSAQERLHRLAYLSGATRVSTRPEAQTSGPRAHIRGTVAAFRALGWKVETFIVGDQLPPGLSRNSERFISGTKLHALAADVGRLSGRFINSVRARRRLGFHFDWAYERFASFQALGRPFQRRGCAWIVESNGLFFREAKSDRNSLLLAGLARRCELAAYRDCDALVCVSKTLKQMICEEASIPAEKILVVSNGVDTEHFNPSLYQPKRMFAGFTVGYMGRLIAWQGLDRLLAAVRDLRSQEGLDIAVTVVGDGAMRSEWQVLAHQLGLSECVSFVGQVNWQDVPRYIAGFDIGFSGQVKLKAGDMYHSPLKIYEYMSMAKPLLASQHDDSASVTEGRRTGFLFAPDDPEDLKRVLRQAYFARNHLPEMGMRARQQVLERHSWLVRVREMVEGVNRMLEKKNENSGTSTAMRY
jgi:glycosyltransferase involved in cell wall biosynthesis